MALSRGLRSVLQVTRNDSGLIEDFHKPGRLAPKIVNHQRFEER